MSKIVKFAKRLALVNHGEQEHGCLSISEHLADVAKHVKKHAKGMPYRNEIVAAAWLHDVIEDTDMTIEDLESYFCDAGFDPDDYWHVTKIVDAVTDEPGSSRKERHLNTYWKIREDASATLVKLCDRRHNQSRSIKHGEIYAAMYAKEYDYFKFALWNPSDYQDLWAELDEQNRKMREML